MATPSAEGVNLPSLKGILKGIKGFALFTVVGIALAFWWKTPADITHLARHADAFWLALLTPLVALDFVIGGIRYRLFFNSGCRDSPAAAGSGPDRTSNPIPTEGFAAD